MADKAPVNPMCPMCEKPVEPGDHVVFGHGDLIHLGCHFDRGGIAESIATLLRRTAGAEYCHSCLARSLQSSYEQVKKAVATLRMSRRYRVTAMSTCSVCRNKWTTIRTDPPSATDGAPPAPRTP